MDERQLTEEELEAREADRISKLAAGSRQKMAVANLLKPDLKTIRRTTSAEHSSPKPAASQPTHVNPALSTAPRAAVNTMPTSPHSRITSGGGAAGGAINANQHNRVTSGGNMPEWKRLQLEREQQEKARLENEAREREKAAQQIKNRVATTGLTMNIVDEITPTFNAAAKVEVFNPNDVPNYVSKPEANRYERQESFDPSATPDFVTKPEANRYERQETFDPRNVPDFVSKPEHDYSYRPETKFDPSSTPDYVSKPSHSYAAHIPEPATAAALGSVKFCPWCGSQAGTGRFCSSCGRELVPAGSLPGAQSAPAPAPAPVHTPAPQQSRVPEPFIAPATVSHKTNKLYQNFSAGGLVAVDGGNELPVSAFGCEANEINVQLVENGKQIQITRTVMENGTSRVDQQKFNLPYQVTPSTLTARYNPRENNGTLRVKFMRPSVNGTPYHGEHEVVKFLVVGQPGSTQQRVAVGVEQNNEFYKFVPGPASPYDTTFTVVLNGSALEFRSAFAFPEGDGIKSVSGKQSVNLPKQPFLEQISLEDLGTRGKAVVIHHQLKATNGHEQHVPDSSIHIQLV